MTDPGREADDSAPVPDGATTRVPGERRLDRPPSDRYREAETRAGASSSPRTVSPTRGLVLASAAALAGAVVIVALGGVLAMALGLIVVAGVLGWVVAASLGFGAGGTISPSRRAWLAAAIALAGVLVGQVGLWLYASSEGGVLSLPEYLGEVYGPLVPLQAVTASVIGWATAR